jgi:hypothetical protein
MSYGYRVSHEKSFVVRALLNGRQLFSVAESMNVPSYTTVSLIIIKSFTTF